MKRFIVSLLGLLAVPLIAQHGIRLTWQLPQTNSIWTHGCGSGAGYDCTFYIFRNQVPTPTTPCSANASDYALLGATLIPNATRYEDDSVVPGSYCYSIATLQQSTRGPMAFLSTGGDISTEPAPATVYSGQLFTPISKCRAVDTRASNGTFGGPTIAMDASRDFPLLSANCGLPSTALTYLLNVTAVPTTNNSGNLTIWPTGSTMPATSDLNYEGSIAIGNEVHVTAGTNGSISVYANGAPTDVVIDVIGYFQ